MNEPKTEDEWREYLERLIATQAEESSQLEFKSGDTLNKAAEIEEGKKKKDKGYSTTNEITKNISGLANAGGGLLIYGIEESQIEDEKSRAGKLVPITESKWLKKDSLGDIAALIQPAIDGLDIIAVRVTTPHAGVCLVVKVPKSTTGHQATDQRYYRRRSHFVEALDDWEVREVMNRSRQPLLVVSSRLWLAKLDPSVVRACGVESTFQVEIENRSSSPAKCWAVVVRLPFRLPIGHVTIEGTEHCRYPNRNYWEVAFDSGSIHSLPASMKITRSIKLVRNGPVELIHPFPDRAEFLIYADEAAPRNCFIKLTEAVDSTVEALEEGRVPA